MLIKLSPVRADAELIISKKGDSLTINGQVFDFGPLPDGATLPAQAIGCDWIIDPVERIAGQLVLTVLLPHGAEASDSARYPADIVNPPDGKLRLPA